MTLRSFLETRWDPFWRRSPNIFIEIRGASVFIYRVIRSNIALVLRVIKKCTGTDPTYRDKTFIALSTYLTPDLTLYAHCKGALWR